MCYGSVTIEMQQSFSNNEVKLFLLDENSRDEKKSLVYNSLRFKWNRKIKNIDTKPYLWSFNQEYDYSIISHLVLIYSLPNIFCLYEILLLEKGI